MTSLKLNAMILVILIALTLISFSFSFSYAHTHQEDGNSIVSYDLDISSITVIKERGFSYGSRSAMFSILPISIYGDKYVILLSGWIFAPRDISDLKEAEVKIASSSLEEKLRFKLVRLGGYLYLFPKLVILPRDTYELEGLPGAKLEFPRDILNERLSPIVFRVLGDVKEFKIVTLKGSLGSTRSLSPKDLSDELNSRADALLLVPKGVIVKSIRIYDKELEVSYREGGSRRIAFPKAIYLGRLTSGTWSLVLVKEIRERESSERSFQVK